MAEEIRFDDGVAYERMMGTWSRLAGDRFLDWLAPRPGLRWIDIGCGNGAFTELIVERCAPAAIHGIDPSAEQLAFARGRPAARMAEFSEGNAQALSFPDNSFDAAVMALVIFFVPDPAKCVGEMARVVVPGGTVSAYTWDIHGGGFPLEPFQLELAALGLKAPLPPGSDASRIDVSRRLWAAAGLEAIDTIEIPVQRTFADFDDFWTTSIGASVGRVVATMTGEDVERLKSGLRVRLPADAAGRITYGARANAIVGRLPN
jgi:ubiquinone/menaquinone biosynthesis C-methylase UbiE